MLMLIYISIIQPTFDYAITIWGYGCDNNLHKIQRLQNRAARIVTGNYDYVTTRGKVTRGNFDRWGTLTLFSFRTSR